MARPKQGYVDAKGNKIPGVTSVISRFKDSGALMFWAFKQGQSGAAHLYEKRDEAGAAGNYAHDLIETHILGQPAPAAPAGMHLDMVEKAQNAFEQFLEWKHQSGIEVIATEKSYTSKKHKFGGTVDAIGKDTKGRIVLLDWKTSGGVYPDYMIQLAAYSLLLEENAPEYKPQGFHIVRVSKDDADFAHHYYGELEDAKKQFLLFLKAYALDEKIKKRCK